MNWTLRHIEDEGIELIDPTDGKICATIVGCTPEALAMIEAAPNLLETSKAVVMVAEMGIEHDPDDECKAKDRAAIAAAKNAITQATTGEKQPITIQTPRPMIQDRSKESILQVVRWAMQEANEIGGPEGADFSDLMYTIETEARRQRENNQSAMHGEEIRDFSQVIEDYRDCITWYLDKGKVRPMEIEFLEQHRADVEVLSHEENRRNQ